MVEYNVKILPTAGKDMNEMVEHLNRFDYQTAIGIYNEITDSIKSLRKFPERFPFVKVPHLRAKGYRFICIKRYIVFYVVKKKTVEIRRVLHEKRNYIEILE
jgi:plasmid stabilization system protein ParE